MNMNPFQTIARLLLAARRAFAEALQPGLCASASPARREALQSAASVVIFRALESFSHRKGLEVAHS